MKGFVKGSLYWLMISNIATLCSFFIMFFSAEILTKEEFGLLGIVMAFLYPLESLKQMGFKEYLISKRNVSIRDEQVVWSLDLLKGLILALIVLVIDLLFIDNEIKKDVGYSFLVLSFILLIDGCVSSKFYTLRKNLEYSKILIANVASSFCQAVFAISFLFLGYGFESILYGYLAKSFALMICGYILAGGSLMLLIEKKVFLEAFKYGGWIFASGVLFFFTSRFDSILIASTQSLKDIGLYAFAFSVSSSLVSSPLKSIPNALFPVLAKEGEGDFWKIWFRVLFFVLFIVLFLSFSFPLLATLLFGDKWEESYYLIQLLFVSMGINSLRLDSYFLASNKTKFKFLSELVRAILFCSLLFPFVYFKGINGAAEAMLLTSFLSLFFWGLLMRKTFDGAKSIL